MHLLLQAFCPQEITVIKKRGRKTKGAMRKCVSGVLACDPGWKRWMKDWEKTNLGSGALKPSPAAVSCFNQWRVNRTLTFLLISHTNTHTQPVCSPHKATPGVCEATRIPAMAQRWWLGPIAFPLENRSFWIPHMPAGYQGVASATALLAAAAAAVGETRPSYFAWLFGRAATSRCSPSRCAKITRGMLRVLF